MPKKARKVHRIPPIYSWSGIADHRATVRSVVLYLDSLQPEDQVREYRYHKMILGPSRFRKLRAELAAYRKSLIARRGER